MSDLDAALASPAAARGGNPTGQLCKVGRILADVTPAQREAILERLDSEGSVTGWSDATLAVALTRGGHPASATTVGVHRRNQCGCPVANESEAS